MTIFQPARREQMRLRAALQGPAGSGKTFTALTLARALSPDGSVAVIDTEGRALEYAQLPGEDRPDRFDFGHVAPREADPAALPGMIAEAARARYGSLLIDSFTHYWSGQGGALDMVDRNRDKRAAWGEYRPIENAMMRALLTYPGHVIVTMRVKTEHVTEVDARGRNVTRRLGLKPDQRDSVDYEFSVIGQMDSEHNLTITKSTCPELSDRTIARPGLDLAKTLELWLGQGDPVKDLNDIRDLVCNPMTDRDELVAAGKEARRLGLLVASVVDQYGDLINLEDLLKREIKDRQPLRLADAVTDAAAAA